MATSSLYNFYIHKSALKQTLAELQHFFVFKMYFCKSANILTLNTHLFDFSKEVIMPDFIKYFAGVKKYGTCLLTILYSISSLNTRICNVLRILLLSKNTCNRLVICFPLLLICLTEVKLAGTHYFLFWNRLNMNGLLCISSKTFLMKNTYLRVLTGVYIAGGTVF